MKALGDFVDLCGDGGGVLDVWRRWVRCFWLRCVPAKRVFCFRLRRWSWGESHGVVTMWRVSCEGVGFQHVGVSWSFWNAWTSDAVSALWAKLKAQCFLLFALRYGLNVLVYMCCFHLGLDPLIKIY